MTRSLDPARIYYCEDTTSIHHDFSSYLDHPESKQKPFRDWVRKSVTIILHGPQFEDFIKRANVELMPVSRYSELFEIAVLHDTYGQADEPIQYNIKFTQGSGEQDHEILSFLRQWDPRNHGWPAERRPA